MSDETTVPPGLRVESCDSGPIVWEWRAEMWIIPVYSLPVQSRKLPVLRERCRVEAGHGRWRLLRRLLRRVPGLRLEATLSEAHTTAETYREAVATLQGRVERLRTLLQSQLDAGTWRHHPMTKMEVEAVMRETGND